jgi:hypothetical protein
MKENSTDLMVHLARKAWRKMDHQDGGSCEEHKVE